MPLFEFSCDKCEKDFELLVRSAKWEGSAECPRCGSKKLKKKLSVFASAGTPASTPAMPAACGMKKRHGGGCGCC